MSDTQFVQLQQEKLQLEKGAANAMRAHDLRAAQQILTGICVGRIAQLREEYHNIRQSMFSNKKTPEEWSNFETFAEWLLHSDQLVVLQVYVNDPRTGSVQIHVSGSLHWRLSVNQDERSTLMERLVQAVTQTLREDAVTEGLPELFVTEPRSAHLHWKISFKVK